MKTRHFELRQSTNGCLKLCLLLVTMTHLVGTPVAGADPSEWPPSPEMETVSAATTACSRFNDAVELAATNYEDFADATSGDQWGYNDPSVRYANVTGRTALRAAAAGVLQASATPGLAPDIASPMRGWSLEAAKLLLMMGVRGNDDSINASATGLNDRTYAVQMACAHAQG